MDGFYQMPSGHIEAGEYPAEAAIREAKEEVGVVIAPSDLEFVHASYRINEVDDAGNYADYFFRATRWEGDVVNTEPEKCDELVWVPIDVLPEHTVPVVKEVMGYIKQGLPFSEVGREKRVAAGTI